MKRTKKGYPCSDRNCERCFYAAICNPEIAEEYREFKQEEKFIYESNMEFSVK